MFNESKPPSAEQELFGKSYYEILGISSAATQEEISDAFKRLSQELHPDKGGDTRRYQFISEAYNTLKDPLKRRDYHKKVGLPFEIADKKIQADLVKRRITNSKLPDEFKNRLLDLPENERKMAINDQTLLDATDDELIKLFGWKNPRDYFRDIFDKK